MASSSDFLKWYSGLLTIVFAVTVFPGAGNPRSQTFGTITVRRINVVEPDGTVRLTISNRADFPGAWRHKKEEPRPDRRDAAGMLFMSEEGTELGGMIWGASEMPDGTIQNHFHLSADQYEENQILAIDAGQQGKEKFSRMSFVDQGDFPVDEKRREQERIEQLPVGERQKAWDQFFSTHRHDVKRVMIGRFPDGSAGLNLLDHEGRLRIVLAVQPDGAPVLQFMDRDGKVIRSFH